jgi:hypothetical protein
LIANIQPPPQAKKEIKIQNMQKYPSSHLATQEGIECTMCSSGRSISIVCGMHIYNKTLEGGDCEFDP